MKKVKILFLGLSLMYSSNIFSQFVTASVTDVGVGAGTMTSVSNTGNDIIDFASAPVVTTVWDDNNSPGIGWNDGSAIGYTNLQTNDATDPDVAFITDGSVYIAVVAYYSANTSGGSFMVEYYTWSGTTMTLTTGITNPAILRS
jgi:hypothetical protein